MTQTLALLLDAYRELNARKMFWITLVLSGLVVAIFALVGINERGLVLAVWTIDLEGFNSTVVSPATFYKMVFTTLGIGIWLTWIAAILALISTATIFPDLVSAGSIDLILSKPIGRLRLFFTKYICGLLFVALQVTVFCVASFVVLGVRGGLWEPRVFLAIPIVLVFFSYLFGICATLGVITRSTIAALLLTLLVWFIIFIVHSTEQTLMTVKLTNEERIEWLEGRVDRAQQSVARFEEESGADEAAQLRLEGARDDVEERREELERAESSAGTVRNVHNILLGVKTALPKTSETVELLNRYLIPQEEFESAMGSDDAPDDQAEEPTMDSQGIQQRVMREIRSRSVVWIIGTSLLFELIVLGLGAWVFCRRDY